MTDESCISGAAEHAREVVDDERCGWCGITPTHDPGDCAVAKAHESQRLADIEQAVADEGRA
jgi:hypothetical protein